MIHVGNETIRHVCTLHAIRGFVVMHSQNIFELIHETSLVEAPKAISFAYFDSNSNLRINLSILISRYLHFFIRKLRFVLLHLHSRRDFVLSTVYSYATNT